MLQQRYDTRFDRSEKERSLTQQASQGDPAETGPRPIVSYLRLPDEKGGDAYLVGKTGG